MTLIGDREDPREDRGSQLRELGWKDTGQLKVQGETTAVTEAQLLSALKHLIHPSDPREPHWRNGGTPCPTVPPLATARVSRLWLSQVSFGESSYLLLSFRFMVPRGDRGLDRLMILFLLWPDCQPPGSCCSVHGV